MNTVLVRLAFIKSAQTALMLLIPLLLVQSSRATSSFVLARVLEALPLLVLGLLGGLLVDRLGAQRVNRLALVAYLVPPAMLACAHLQWLPTSILPLASMGAVALGQLLVLCGDRVVLDKIPSDDLPRYNANAILIERATSLALPPVLGGLALWSLDAAVCATAALGMLGALCLAWLSPNGQSTANATRMSISEQLRAGFSALAGERFLRDLILIAMLVNGLEAVPIAYTFLYAHEGLHMNAAEIGMLTTMTGLGGLCAATLARQLKTSRARLLSIFVASMLVNATLYALIWVLNHKYALLAAKLLEAFSFVFSAVAYRTLRQEHTAKALFGTISGAVGFTVKLCIPFTILLAGVMLAGVAPQDLFLGTAIAELLLAVCVGAWARRQVTRFDKKAYA
ncbi:MFS transporter [Roseateles depolymerans]|uniref:Uncharacterized protein n=1 Tax=Roseateles depolymerans TaxID=76731 RepID=A0A0U3MTJ4_9BURK|nr:MFS transporter [Roseateles depolymerans]ALV05188.1 hypothetical protein RD2015_692 [Roseateles depolymerans]REG14796.1 MFS transporter [Roseateles depolymerans]